MVGNVHGRNEILELSNKVKSNDLKYLESVVPETLLELDKNLNYRFVVDQVFVNTLKDVRNNLDIQKKIDELKKKLDDTTIDPTTWSPMWLNDRITELNNKIIDPSSWIDKKIADEQNKRSLWGLSNDDRKTSLDNEQSLLREKSQIEAKIQQLITEKKPIEDEIKSLEAFWKMYKSMVKSWPNTLMKRIKSITDIADKYNFSSILSRETTTFGDTTYSSFINLDNEFLKTWFSWIPEYTLCDPDTLDKINSEHSNTYKVKTIDWQEVTIKGIQIDQNTKQLRLHNITIDPADFDYPVNINLSVRARTQDSQTGVNLDCHKNFGITINEPNRGLSRRETEVNTIEWDLDRDFLEQRLRQEYENRFNTVQRTAFEKVLEKNPEFTKLNQTQKDALYERMEDLGPLINSVDINLWTDSGGNPYGHTIDEIIFSPGNHEYSTMPNEEDYDTFRGWLSNQTPKDVLTDADKYRQRLRNGLVASLDDGETHYTSYFNDVLKKFTDDAGVQTTLNKTLLEFINDTNTADHNWFEADLLANLTANEHARSPETTTTKKWYERLMRWKNGEKQNYLSFFQWQSHAFKAESIKVGWETFSYSGNLTIDGAQSVSLSMKMQDGKEKIYQWWSPIHLVMSLLRNPDIEPSHARFHAGLSVVKSIAHMARDNGISLRTGLSDEMLNTLPIHVRNALGTGDNPMVEVEEVNGKLVANVFNLNLTTRQKENQYTIFDENAFNKSQSVRDLRQWVESLLSLTNQTMNNVYGQYRAARFRSRLRPGLLKKPKRGGLRNMYKKLSFTGESLSVWGKSFNLDCKNGLFTLSWWDLKKPLEGRNLWDMIAYNPALRGVELKALHTANEKMLAMYQDKLNKQNRHHNHGVIDEANHRAYIYDKNGNLGYVDTDDQEFVSRRRQYTSWRRYGRISDDNMPNGFTVMKRWDTVVDKENYDNFLLNETLVWSMVRSMSRTHRAWTTWAPW